jgi:S-phase kinase-associated protein 1
MDDIIVETSDGMEMKVSKKILEKSETLNQDLGAQSGKLPIPNVTSYVLMEIDKILHQDVVGDSLPLYPDDFNLLIELTSAFNFLDMPEQLTQICRKHAEILRDKSPEEIRHLYNLPDDLTPSEKEQLKKDNAWAIAED